MHAAFSFVSFVLVTIPLPWHFQAQNSATCLYILWVSLSNLTSFINSVLWDGNISDKSPVWCDISTRLITAANIAIPLTFVCLQHRIYHIISNPFAANAAAHKRSRVVYDLLICLGFPLLNLVLVYFVQSHRYGIVEDIGCHTVLDRTAPSVVLVVGLRLAVGLVSSAYGCLNMYQIWTKRREVKYLFSTSAGSISYDHYIKLFIFSSIDILITVPFVSWCFTTWFPVTTWPGWNKVHSDWSQIPIVASAELRSEVQTILSLEFPQWMTVTYGILFFIFFGVGTEARRQYASVWLHVSCWQTRLSRESPTHGNVHITFATSRHSDFDKSDSLTSSYGISEYIVTPSTISDARPNSEEASCTAPGNLTQPSHVSQQSHILLPSTPLDLESGFWVEPPVLKGSDRGI